MKKRYRTIVLILLAQITIGCSKTGNAEADAGTAVATVRTQAISAVTMRSTLDVFGTVAFSPEMLRTVDMGAEVRVEKVLVSAGETVHAGQALLSVQPTANSSLELQHASTDVAFTQQELARIQALRQQQLATNSEVAAARQARDNAQATLSSVHTRLGDTRTGEIRADRDEVVASVDVQRGATVAAGTPLLHLADRADLQLRLGVEPEDLSRLREGQQVTATAVYDDKVIATGRIVKLVREVDTQTRLAGALVDVDAASGLLPGSTVKAAVVLEQRDKVVVVPRRAVLYEEKRPYIYVVEADKAKQVWVTLGEDDGQQIEIVSGAGVGDQVVVEGNYELQDGMAVKLQVKPS